METLVDEKKNAKAGVLKQSPIARVAVATPVRKLFDYLCPMALLKEKNLQPGLRIKIPFGSRQVVGILVEVAQQSNYSATKLKPILELLDVAPLFDENLLKLCHLISDYYQHSLGEVLATALPTLLRQGKPAEIKKPLLAERKKIMSPLLLNEAQQQAFEMILSKQRQFQPFLLDGVTGSGKTEIYLQVIAEILKQAKQALVLVPEIGLTPQTIARFTDRFTVPVIAFHSGLTERQRCNAWLQAASEKISIVIGTRSAVFTPLKNLGVIIIDEEHDLSYKQQEGLRYHARDVAVLRAHLLNIPIILGSATPSLESYCNAQRNRYQHLHLPARAGNAILPSFRIFDLRQQIVNSGLSHNLLQRMEMHLNNNNQVLLFLNRRGFASVVMCYLCGWTARCQRCDAHLTLHHAPQRLVCHHCGATARLEGRCGQCEKTTVYSYGVGTEKLEKALRNHFPDTAVFRIDRDSTRRKGELTKILDQIKNGERQILVGTQMLAKGHHFPNVTLVAVIDVDGGLLSSDFRGPERLGQLLMQVAGRAGRAEKAGEVIIQSYQPEHSLLQALLQKGYHSFLECIIEERKQMQLPPFSHLALLRADGHRPQLAFDFLQEIATESQAFLSEQLKIFGPVPALMEKKAGRFRAQLLIASPQRSKLHAFLPTLHEIIQRQKRANRIRWSLDVDPMEMF